MLQVNLTQELIDALLDLPKQVAGLKAHLKTVLEENLTLKLGLQHFTKEETGELLRVSRTTLEKWEESGVFVPIRIGNKRIYSGEMIRDFSRHHQLPISTQEADWMPTKVRKLNSSHSGQTAA